MIFHRIRRRLMGNHRFRHREGSHLHPLRVPLSSREKGMFRRRVLLRTVKWLGAGAALAWAVIAAGDLWEQAFRNNRTYAVGQFELITNGAITAPQVASVTGLRPDQNITALDLGQLRRQLLTLPQVRSADVERRIPNHLSIRLEERRPVAWLSCAAQGLREFDSHGLLLDEDGVVFPVSVLLEEYTALPVINCAALPPVTPGRTVGDPLVRQALELVTLMRRQNWIQPIVLEKIHLFNAYTMVAQTGSDALFTFHPEQLEKQIARLDAILRKVGTAGRRVASVNLQLERNVPVTFSEAAPAGSPKDGARAVPDKRPSAKAGRRGA